MAITTTSAILIGITVAAAAAAAAQQAAAASAAARATEKAARANNEIAQEELSRQQTEVQEAEQEEKSDRMRQADRELGSLRVAEDQLGLTSTAFLGFVNEVAAIEGIDLARISDNAEEQRAALQSRKEAVAQDAINNINQANIQASNDKNKAVVGAVGSSLQISRGILRDDPEFNNAGNKIRVRRR
jgi:Zn-dependent metalloprotease